MDDNVLNTFISSGSFLYIWDENLNDYLNKIKIKPEYIKKTPHKVNSVIITNAENIENDIFYVKFYNGDTSFQEEQILSSLLIKENITNKEWNFTLCKYNNEKIIALTDYWGANSLYYFKNNNKLFISDNQFLINYFVKQKLNRLSIYEILFFNYPLYKNSYFENIYSLEPGQRLIFDINRKTISLSTIINHNTLLENSTTDYVGIFDENMKKYIYGCKNKGNNNVISLSSGSDSRTILASLIYHKDIPYAYYFGTNNYYETELISKLIKSTNLESTIVDLDEIYNNIINEIDQSIICTNGLLNPLRYHYYKFYNAIPKNSNVYHGFFGSEFVKGEIANDAMISNLHIEMLINSGDIRTVINKYYKELDERFKNEMAEYINDNYNKILVSNNTNKNDHYLTMFLLLYEPSKVFSCFFQLVNYYQQNIIVPYLNSDFLKSLFSNNYGIKNYKSIFSNHPGPIKSIIPQSNIVKTYDKKLYESMLDRGISFKEALGKNVKLVNNIRKIRLWSDRINSIVKNKFIGQIQNNIVESMISNYLFKNKYGNSIIQNNTNGKNTLLNKHLYNISRIESIAKRN